MFRCEKCEIFFKSKKGYEGHVANRHTPRYKKKFKFKLKFQNLSLSSSTVSKISLRVLGLDGRLKSKKEIEGLNKVLGIKIILGANLLTRRRCRLKRRRRWCRRSSRR